MINWHKRSVSALAMLLSFVFILSSLSFLPTNAKGIPPTLPPFVLLHPNQDIYTVPYTEYPGTWNNGWFAYPDSGPEETGFWWQLQDNDTDTPVFWRGLYWGDWAEMRLGFDNLDIDWDAYKIVMYLRKGPNAFNFYMGFWDTINNRGSASYHINDNGIAEYNVNPATGFPFTKEELNNIQGRILILNTDALQCSWNYFNIKAIPVESPIYSERAILRPIADAYTDWNPYPASPTTSFDKINETTPYSDNMTTYIYMSEIGTITGYFNMSKLPPQFNFLGMQFHLRIWVIAKTSHYNDTARMNFGIISQLGKPSVSISVDLSPAWYNYTLSVETNPDTGMPWTYQEINKIITEVKAWGAKHGCQILVSQMAVLVYWRPIPYVSPFDESEVSHTMVSLVWILIIFSPALIMEQFIPKVGFIAGMSLMLLVWGFSQVGALPFMVMGFAIIGTLVYKGV